MIVIRASLLKLIDEHIDRTASPWASRIRQNLEQYLDYFTVVVPKASGQLSNDVTLLKVR